METITGDRPSGIGEGFDVIGDVHGCLSTLIDLLRRLGYSDDRGYFAHRHRTAVFVGDLIDGGTDQVGVLRVVRSMCQAGSAAVVMGNHEFNAVAYATPYPGRAGEYLRAHNTKNHGQHADFLREVGFGSADHDEIIGW